MPVPSSLVAWHVCEAAFLRSPCRFWVRLTVMVRALCCDAQLCALHQRHAAHGTTVTAEEERDIVTRMVLTDGARRRRSFEEACATVAATVTSVSAAALGVGEESEDENEMGPEEEPLGAMRSEGATDLGD